MKVGIDFGTSTSEIAFCDSEGKVTVVPNHLGEIITPSVVHFEANGKAVVGREALEMAILEPENTFLEVKRLFGQDVRLESRGRVYEPVEVAAQIISYLVRCAQEHTGEIINSAVVTVPAYFTDAQRKDVMAAGNMAGVEVSRIINEPTAASLDYGIKHMRDCNHMLVYDLGGGTLDVTVLELFEGVVDVKSSCGNNTLGGKDFDQAITDYIVRNIKKQSDVDITGDKRAMMRIKIAAEECKIALSTQDSHEVELPFLFEDKKGEPRGFAEKITRNAFDNMIKGMIHSTKTQIDTALTDANLTADDIDLTLMVGGSTRIPLVKDFLEKQFGFTPAQATDPDLAVVAGAAIQAAVLDGTLSENAVILTDICSYSLSTGTLRDKGCSCCLEQYCDILIPRNSTLPASASKIYMTAHDDQRIVHISAYQGESEDPDENYLLNKFVLSGIPKGRAGTQKINIEFEYDLNGILTVNAQIVSTGKKVTAAIDTSGLGKGLDLSAWKDHEKAKDYRRFINKADRLAKVHGEDAQDLTSAANELKKAMVLNWEDDILKHLLNDLQSEIDDME